MSRPQPPRWLERILEWTLPAGLSGQATLGDLAEDFERRAARSVTRARLWYAGQAVSILGYWLAAGGAPESSGNSDLWMDIRWSLRSMVRHRGFSVGVILVLGLGLGANVAVFAVVDGTLRNTSWWGEPDAAVAIWPESRFSAGQLDLYAQQQTVYQTVGGYQEMAFALRTPDGESESVNGVRITPSLFRALAVQPEQGRALADDDALLGGEPVALISERLWRRSLNADPSIVGSTLDIGGSRVTVVGVQAAGASAPGGRADVWLPFVGDPRDDDFWKAQVLTLVGVLSPGATMPDAFADLQSFTERLTQLFPMFYPAGYADGLANVTRADAAQRRLISTPLLLLLVGTALLMVITALNVGNLLLGRAIDRRRELALRRALGAGRGRIVRQLLVEGLVLTSLALTVALFCAAIGGDRLARLFVGASVVASSAIVSPRVLGFAALVSLVAWTVLTGVPILHFLRSQRSGPRVTPASGNRMQRSLVTIQASLATLLLVAATLLIATVSNLRRVPLGFEPQGLLAVELSPPQDRVATLPRARTLYDALVERVAGLPGVESAGLTGWLPLRSDAPPTPINLAAAPVDPAQAVRAPLHMVDAGFFEAFGLEPVAGRVLGSQDRADRPSAVVVNQTLAGRLWPDRSPLGQRIAIDPHAWDSWALVVGVVPDLRSQDITQPSGPALYVPLAESPARDLTLVVRTTGDEGPLLPQLLRTIADVDPLVPIRSEATMDDVVRAAYATSWVLMGLLIAMAIMSTVLGAIGIYAVLAHYVSSHRREIGVRMALGAQPRTMVGALMKSGLLLAGSGVAIGSVVALLTTRLLDSLLFGVTALAPVAFLAPAFALILAAALATWGPAAHAARLAPAEVLRAD